MEHASGNDPAPSIVPRRLCSFKPSSPKEKGTAKAVPFFDKVRRETFRYLFTSIRTVTYSLIWYPLYPRI